jgi:drug/metabolite transporter (DMT)-like permease
MTENRTRGILWMLATMFCFIALDALIKKGLEFMPLLMVTWGRFAFATTFAILVAHRNLPRLLHSQSPRQQVLRSIFLLLTTGLFAAGISKVPLATATTIMFMSPVLVTLLAVFILSEHVGIRRWLSIAVAFAGSVIVADPWGNASDSMTVGAMFLLAAACTNALYQITTRQVRGDDPLTSLLFTAAAGAIVTTALLPFYGIWPTAFGWVLLVASGFLGCISHLCIIKAFQNAPASVVAPFSYSALLWALLFGFVFWNEVPPSTTWMGAALIISSGLYIFFREQKLKRSST